jgi:hypothetical protein
MNLPRNLDEFRAVAVQAIESEGIVSPASKLLISALDELITKISLIQAGVESPDSMSWCQQAIGSGIVSMVETHLRRFS